MKDDDDSSQDPDDDDDAALFRRAAAGARPVAVKFAELPKKRPPPRARFSRRDEAEALLESLDVDVDELEVSAAERLRFRRPELGERTLRRLSRGRYAVQAELDLHGMTAAQAEVALRDFINNSLQRGHRCVRVIHGKGLGSGLGGPVLKDRVNRWLRRWREVLAFVSARQVDGGAGAVYVLLRAE